MRYLPIKPICTAILAFCAFSLQSSSVAEAQQSASRGKCRQGDVAACRKACRRGRVKACKKLKRLGLRQQRSSPPDGLFGENATFTSEQFWPGMKTPKMRGKLSMPSGKGPFPAVVLLPNCGGSTTFEFAEFWPRYLNKLGYATLNVDIFGPRGRKRCTKSFRPRLRAITQDAYGALHFLAGVADVDASRIGVLGSSLGASAINAFAGRNRSIKTSLRFRAGVSLYPHHCRKVRPQQNMMPLAVIQGDGEKDVPSCRRVDGRGRVMVYILANAYHGFDQTRARRRRDGSFKSDVGGTKRLFSKRATQASQKIVRAFLAQHLSIASTYDRLSFELQRKRRRDPFRAVRKRDADGDNRVSVGEWEKSASVFAEIDQNSDGFLTGEEFFRHWEKLGRRRRH